jgi:hypothetical protein
MGKKGAEISQSMFQIPYTVTKANQSEVVLWKIAVLGMKKSVLVLEHFVTRPCGILHSSMPE